VFLPCSPSSVALLHRTQPPLEGSDPVCAMLVWGSLHFTFHLQALCLFPLWRAHSIYSYPASLPSFSLSICSSFPTPPTESALPRLLVRYFSAELEVHLGGKSVCLVCVRHWVQSQDHLKKRERVFFITDFQKIKYNTPPRWVSCVCAFMKCGKILPIISLTLHIPVLSSPPPPF
jgi:hypothetical protein